MKPRAFGLALAALLSACTAVKATYDNLDWIVDWQIGRYVDLDSQQKNALEQAFGQVWHWHRGTQLKLYVADLRDIAAQVDKPLGAARIEAYYDLATAHLNRALQGALPEIARLLQTLDDRQVAELLENMADKRDRNRQKNEDLGPEGVKDQAERNMLKNLKRWTGPLTADQKARVQRWSRARRYAGAQGFQYQETWAQSFGALLAHRQANDFPQRLAALFRDVRQPPDPRMAELQAANRRNWIALATDLSAGLNERQRRHLHDAVLEFAADLDTLAAES